MERACKVPMYFDNDANMGARGESQYGAARNVDNMAYVKVATGIGCGLIVNGDIYRGAAAAAANWDMSRLTTMARSATAVTVAVWRWWQERPL